MCGRFTLDIEPEAMTNYLYEHYQIENLNEDIRLPRYNVAPGQQILTVLNDGKKYRAGTLKWGFVPFFSKDEKIGYKMINARAETLAEKASFKQSLVNKRCIILADGFYEWKKENNAKFPMRFRLKERELFSFAGLWSSYTREDGTKLYTCTIITTTPNSLVSPVHDRMPVILTKDAEKIWLNPEQKDPQLLTSLLNPYDVNHMEVYPVSSLVNSTKYDQKECIEAV
jgi:putative SOS response-associated peptidase YedK